MTSTTFPLLKSLMVKKQGLPTIFLAYVSCFLWCSEWPQFITSYRWMTYFELRYHSVSGFQQSVCSSCSYIPLCLTCQGVSLYKYRLRMLAQASWTSHRVTRRLRSFMWMWFFFCRWWSLDDEECLQLKEQLCLAEQRKRRFPPPPFLALWPEAVRKWFCSFTDQQNLQWIWMKPSHFGQFVPSEINTRIQLP